MSLSKKIDFFTKCNIWLKSNFWILLIFGIGFGLRFFQYAEFPFSGETADEYAWSFLGASLIQEQSPASWSYFPSYKGYELPLENPLGGSPLVQPVLDHPPLFSFIPGIFHAARGPWWEMPSIKLIRLPMIFLGTINLGLLWLVARRLLPKPWALVATTIFAIAPSFVFTSRMVLAENLLQTWALLFVLAGIHPKTKDQPTFYFVLLSVLALLTKTSGIIFPASLLLVGILQKKASLVKSGLVSTLVAVAVYLFYGAIINWQLFISVMADQSSRSIGLATLYNRLMIHPSIVEKMFFDGWILLGLGAMAVVSVQKYKTKNNWNLPIALFVSNLFFIALTVGEDTFHAWYDYAWYPFFALAIGYVAQKIWQDRRVLESWLVWLIMLPLLRTVLIGFNLYDELGNWSMRGLILLGGLPLLLAYFPKPKWSRWALGGLSAIVLACSILVILKMDLTIYSRVSTYFFHCDGRCF